nr:fcp1 homology domain-containing protein [Melanopsichium pennsylvanicum 4]
MAFGQAQFMRSQPRPEYMIQANTPSQTLTEEEAKHRKLLVVLDLNGTLVFRAKSGNGRALDSVRAVPRPYLSCFLQYCLGLSSINTTIFADQVERAKEVEIAQRPHGSQFWANAPQQSRGPTTSVLEPHSKGQAEVVVWSSAQPYNVDSMVLASFDQAVRSRILRVWARDTLVPARFYQHKAESIKDLEVVWAELNAFANNLGSPGRILAEDRHQADQLRPDAILACTNLNDSTKQQQKAEKAKLQKENQPMSAALKAAKRAQELGPWSWENTVLVDDSVTKARLQPWNHLLIPEYDKVEAGRMKKFIRQELATCRFAIDEQSGSAELEYDSDLSLTQDKAASMSTTNNHVSCANKKPMPESRLDDVLLQTIGVLETLRYQSNVCAFIYSGGIQGYGQERSKVILTQEEYKERVEKVNTPEYWAHKGRQICDKLGIEVKAWAMGASSTSALV